MARHRGGAAVNVLLVLAIAGVAYWLLMRKGGVSLPKQAQAVVSSFFPKDSPLLKPLSDRELGRLDVLIAQNNAQTKASGGTPPGSIPILWSPFKV